MKQVGKEFVFLVVGEGCSGKAQTEAGARKNAMKAAGLRKLDGYLVYLAPPDVRVSQAGSLRWQDATAEAVLLKKVVGVKEAVLTDDDCRAALSVPDEGEWPEKIQ